MEKQVQRGSHWWKMTMKSCSEIKSAGGENFLPDNQLCYEYTALECQMLPLMSRKLEYQPSSPWEKEVKADQTKYQLSTCSEIQTRGKVQPSSQREKNRFYQLNALSTRTVHKLRTWNICKRPSTATQRMKAMALKLEEKYACKVAPHGCHPQLQCHQFQGTESDICTLKNMNNELLQIFN